MPAGEFADDLLDPVEIKSTVPKRELLTLTKLTAKIVAEKQAKLIRYRKGSYKDLGVAKYDAKDYFDGNRGNNWTLMDMVTANMLQTVYNALKPELQAKFNNIPLGKLVELGWKVCK